MHKKRAWKNHAPNQELLACTTIEQLNANANTGNHRNHSNANNGTRIHGRTENIIGVFHVRRPPTRERSRRSQSRSRKNKSTKAKHLVPYRFDFFIHNNLNRFNQPQEETKH